MRQQYTKLVNVQVSVKTTSALQFAASLWDSALYCSDTNSEYKHVTAYISLQFSAVLPVSQFSVHMLQSDCLCICDSQQRSVLDCMVHGLVTCTTCEYDMKQECFYTQIK